MLEVSEIVTLSPAEAEKNAISRANVSTKIRMSKFIR
jgi:hypothetical protein